MKNPLKKFTNKQLLAELDRRKRKDKPLIAVFNKDKLGKHSSIYKFRMKDFKGLNIKEITSEKLNKDIICMITDKNAWLAQFK